MKNEHPSPQLQVEAWLDTQRDTSRTIAITIIIPAFNEYRRLPVTLMENISYLDEQVAEGTIPSYEIIVVDDGSRDDTSGVVQKFCRIRPQVRLIRLPKNQGKGHAVRVGVMNALGNCILFADADGASPIHEIAKLQQAILNGADIAIGSRAVKSEATTVTTSWHRKYLGRCFNLAVNIFLVPGIADTQCGFKMFTSRSAHFLFQRQTADRFSFDVELLYLAQKVGMRIDEVAINWTNIPGSKVNLVFDSLRMFRDLFIFRMRHRRVEKTEWQNSEQQNYNS